MPRGGYYVNNSFNQSLGRVGMPMGSAVHSSGSSSGGGGGGGSSSYSSPVSLSPSTYVDNISNRALGRVGLPLGSAVHSTGGSSNNSKGSNSSSSGTYVDNSSNRALGRVGLPLGTAVHSSTEKSHQSGSDGFKTYVDNSYNKKLGRVGLKIGSAVHSGSSSNGNGTGGSFTKNSDTSTKLYVDNANNRRLGRVGKVVGSAPVASRSTEPKMIDLSQNVFGPLKQFDAEDTDTEIILKDYIRRQQETIGDLQIKLQVETAIGIVYRHEAAINHNRAGLQHPNWLKGGEVINFSELSFGEKIGGGGFGDVFVAIWKENYQVAVKKLRVQRVSQEKKEQFQKEVQVFSSLNHPGIIKFHGVCTVSPNLAIVMEFMASGSLYDVIHVEKRQLSLEQKRQMITDCLSALKYLHENEVAHRDIKSMNILVTEDLEHCKLGDFGLALKEETRTSASVADHGVVGTLRYSSPEVLEGENLNFQAFKAVDVYAISIVIAELLMEKEPFVGLNQHQVRRAILAGERPSLEGIETGLSKLLTSAMAKLPANRPSASKFFSEWERISRDVDYKVCIETASPKSISTMIKNLDLD